MWYVVFFVHIAVAIVFVKSVSLNKESQCGYASCPEVKPEKLNVHLIPHSHVDLGWLKTVDQYFYGTHMEIQIADVREIIYSVISELEVDPCRRFIWVETAYMWQWWTHASDHEMREKVRRLVNNGQLEITGGGCSMNDEAVTHYQSTIDQFTWGFRQVDKMFGKCGRPHIGWQIDPFGHSRENAALMAQFGFDGLFIARLDFRDKKNRLRHKSAEFVWKGSQNQGKSSWIFTNILYNNYSPPEGFCFDMYCTVETINDQRTDFDYNLERRINDFIMAAKQQAAAYRTNNIIMTMGNDFTYSDAYSWFSNLDKIIKYTNEGGEINVFYSTPACYMKSVNNANLTWSTKQDDFFPYASGQHAYWTGFYTSRPTLKIFERKGNNLLQVYKQLHVLANISEKNWADLSSLSRIMGIMQHHDAITGTEQQHVAFDYAMRLSKALHDSHNASNYALNKIMKKSEKSHNLNMKSCLLLNISQCATSETSNSFVVMVYNPLARVVSHFVRVPVPQSKYTVFDPEGEELMTQLVPIPQTVLNIPGRESAATQELVFKAADLPPLGFKTYFIHKSEDKVNVAQSVKDENRLKIENEYISATIDAHTNLLSSLTRGNAYTRIQQSFEYYESISSAGGVQFSGAYVFRPNNNASKPFTTNITAFTYKGPLVQEIHQNITDWISQVIRIYQGESYLEFEWNVGPISTELQIGSEIITRFATDWKTNGLFYTDSNGRETMERKRDTRATFEVDMAEPVSANYYPVTSYIAIKTDNEELSVLPDRAQGGSSLRDGEIELMVHRRIKTDDGYGVSEALDEKAYGQGLVARGRHIVVFDSISNTTRVRAQSRQLSQSHMVLAPMLTFASIKLTPQQWQQQYVTQYSGLHSALPDNVHLLTLEPWEESGLLLRLEHFFEKEDDPELSKSATVELKDLFSAFSITSVQEMTLGANQKIEEKSRLVWHVDGNESSEVKNNVEPPTSSNNFAVTLKPMQIRTFVIKVETKYK